MAKEAAPVEEAMAPGGMALVAAEAVAREMAQRVEA